LVLLVVVVVVHVAPSLFLTKTFCRDELDNFMLLFDVLSAITAGLRRLFSFVPLTWAMGCETC
ncbi:hypothetical protein T12_12485, partial [Trichinella patagoniensis]